MSEQNPLIIPYASNPVYNYTRFIDVTSTVTKIGDDADDDNSVKCQFVMMIN